MSYLSNSIKKVFTGWESSQSELLRSILIISVGTLFCKLVALVKEIYVAGNFGTDSHIDGFFFAFAIISYLVSLVGNSFTVSVIPTYILHKKDYGIISANNLLNLFVFYYIHSYVAYFNRSVYCFSLFSTYHNE